ncbi:recombinase family protein [Pseudoduganella sp. FT93W]|uniref:Recombinase family protein n=1 Tax=Duganella fentianensis TaxID=2692177 RepID=A0A845I307_9BURK|nr:recombinase family protein [Duganella fentianensis]MYN47649.1 recombinase family protein [Duganella fentianensis]
MRRNIPKSIQPAALDRRAVAYVRMSTKRQEYFTRNQLDTIEKYAEERSLTLVKVYEDEGKSGLTKRGRPGLCRLIEDVKQNHDFAFILVYDVTRWGRFQDIDESAYYEYLCRINGVNVAYCAEVFENDGSPYASIIKALKRIAAADFSRELSVKVYAAD